MKLSIKIFILFYFSVLFYGCSDKTVAAGAGGETTNGIAARIVLQNGNPAVGATVLLRERGYVASLSSGETIDTTFYNTTTDSVGEFSFAELEEGSYSIEVKNDTSTVLIACTIDSEGILDLGKSTLKPFARISGLIDTSNIDGNLDKYYVQVLGLERLLQVKSDGEFIANDLPEASVKIHLVSNDKPDDAIVKASGIRVRSGEESSIAIDPQWSNFKRVYLNTTASGADLSDDVLSYPLLVRLSDSTFDFETMPDDDLDLQFFDNKGMMLSQQIEQWNSSSKSAAIWIKMDTIFGASDSQWIEMRWGNASLKTQQSSTDVFGEIGGFSGVWHLNDIESITNSVDSTFDGENFGTSNIQGLIGDAFNLENNSYAMLPPEAFSVIDSQVTISVWQYGIDLLELRQATLFDGRISDTTENHLLLVHVPWFVNDSISRAYWDAGANAQDSNRILYNVEPDQYQGQWNYWTLTKSTNTGEMKMFLNGEMVRSDVEKYSSMSGVGIFKLGGNLDDGLPNYNGYLDEFRASHIERSSEWIKLNYENQKVGSAFVIVDTVE